MTIEVTENLLTVQGRKGASDEARRYLHRGLAEHDFERPFQLADYVVVTDANLAEGLLSISLKRELPEALKPRRIRDRLEPIVTDRRRKKPPNFDVVSKRRLEFGWRSFLRVPPVRHQIWSDRGSPIWRGPCRNRPRG